MNIELLSKQLTINLSLQGINKDKSKEILKSIDMVLQKVDQLILLDFIAANKGLEDILTSKAYDSPLLSKIQDCYIKNTGLSPEGSTGGIKNTEIIAYAYLGLYIIGLIENENESLLIRYVLHMFETGERMVRNNWFPDVYQQVFKPECLTIINSYSQKIEKIAKSSDYIQYTVVRALQAGLLVLGLAEYAVVKNNSLGHRLRQLDDKIPKVHYFETKEGIMKDIEMEIDKHCAFIASEMLKNM